MKANPLRWFLFLLLEGAVAQLPAQQSEADHKLLTDVRAKAEKGDAQCQYELGRAFSFGNLGVAKDEVEAVKWFRKAAEQDFAVAQFNLGECHYEGQGVAKDYAEAVKWYRKAAEQHLALAQYNLGVCYAKGQGVAKDYAEAVEWYRKAAQQNDDAAQNALGDCYESGQGVPVNTGEALEWYRKAADQGNANGQFALGGCYFYGSGVAKDAVEAVQWYRKAADQGNANGQFALGGCYFYGNGVPKDAAQAVTWYRKAAEQGLAFAQMDLGICYKNGSGVPGDAAEAVKWWRRAAEQNHPVAQYSLGGCYAYGDGVTKDAAEAVKWYRKAAEQTYAEAQFCLGVYYANGEGVAQDYVEAVNWYRKAAEQGYADAQNALGDCYYDGKGAPKDYLEAYKWWLLSSAQNNENAKINVTRLGGQMSPEQIAEARKLAQIFKPRDVLLPEGEGSSDALIRQTHTESSGSGFFITEDGYLISNEHLTGKGALVRLVTSAGLISAKVVKLDSANDLALLKAEGKFASLAVASNRTLRPGSTLATVGFPNIGLQGFAPKLAKGEIAALAGAQDDPKYLQISVPVQPGNSGGALVDEHGNVVGVVAAKLNMSAALATSGALPENVNYVLKSSCLLSFLESVPEVAAKLKEPSTKDCKFEDVVKAAEQAAVLVLVY